MIYFLYLVEQEQKQKSNKKGRTWGPSSIYQKEKEKRRKEKRSRLYSSDTTVQHQGRSSSFPNLGIALTRPDTTEPQTPRDLSKFIILIFIRPNYLYSKIGCCCCCLFVVVVVCLFVVVVVVVVVLQGDHLYRN